MKEFDELGLFWLPGHEEDALSGRLQFDPKEGGINLSLVGGFDNAPDHGDSSKLRILGWRGNDRVTLDQCLSLGTNRRAPGVPESRYYANQMFVGHHFEEEELSFQSASLRLSDLDSWVGRSGIAVEDDHSGWVAPSALPRSDAADVRVGFRSGESIRRSVGRAGMRTWMVRPPSRRGMAWTSPAWAWATERTMDRPSPAPWLPLTAARRSVVASRRKGSNRLGIS